MPFRSWQPSHGERLNLSLNAPVAFGKGGASVAAIKTEDIFATAKAPFPVWQPEL
jgi:hypothetical protein